MNETVPLSLRRMILGVVCGSLVGLLSYTVLEAGTDLLTQLIAFRFFGFEWSEPYFFEMVGVYLLFGTPAALVFGLVIGLPVWKVAEDRPLRSKRSALVYGSITGSLIGLILLLLGLVAGLQTFLDDTSSYDSYSFGYQVTKDGLPTALGWLLQLKMLLFFFAAGALGGIAARLVVVRR